MRRSGRSAAMSVADVARRSGGVTFEIRVFCACAKPAPGPSLMLQVIGHHRPRTRVPACGRRGDDQARLRVQLEGPHRAEAQVGRPVLHSSGLGRRDHHRAELDTASVCAGLLHDVVEDTLATTKDIEREFGDEVASLVDGVTKLGKINFTSKEDRQAENFRKMVVAMARDIRVLLIKLCDRVDNMRTLEHMKPEAQERIARETLEIYAPLANRLGIQAFKSELEDLVVPLARAGRVRRGRERGRRRRRRSATSTSPRSRRRSRAGSPSRASPPTSPAARSTSTRSGAR